MERTLPSARRPGRWPRHKFATWRPSEGTSPEPSRAPISRPCSASIARRWSCSRPPARAVPLADFFRGPRQTVRQDDEIVAALVVPPPGARFGAAYARFALREGNAIAVASSAASMSLDEGGTIRRAAVMLGAVAPQPTAVGEVESLLSGRTLAEGMDEAVRAAMSACAPISDLRGSADYRRHLVGVLTRRALTAAASRAAAR